MMDLSERPWKEIVDNALACLALGITRVHLFRRDDQDFPWQFAETCEPGGSHRLEISTGVRFTGKHPCGITFTWCFDIEPYSANGSGQYHIECEGISNVLAKLPEAAAEGFRAYLRDCADKVYKKGEEWQQIATKQFVDAQILRSLISK